MASNYNSITWQIEGIVCMSSFQIFGFALTTAINKHACWMKINLNFPFRPMHWTEFSKKNLPGPSKPIGTLLGTAGWGGSTGVGTSYPGYWFGYKFGFGGWGSPTPSNPIQLNGKIWLENKRPALGRICICARNQKLGAPHIDNMIVRGI